jgi:hypothetical protein
MMLGATFEAEPNLKVKAELLWLLASKYPEY